MESSYCWICANAPKPDGLQRLALCVDHLKFRVMHLITKEPASFWVGK